MNLINNLEPISGSVNGGPTCQPNEHLKNIPLPHDFIKYFIKSKSNIFEVAKPLYENNHSVAEIAEKLKIPESTVRDAMKSHGFVFRGEAASQKIKAQKERSKTGGKTPFGYHWLNGELVVDPREYKIVLEIVKLRQSGQTLRAIARTLDSKKIPHRMSTQWHHGVVNKILKRYKKTNLNGGLK